MGSVDDRSYEDEVTVLVTGFGPFKKEYPVNPSWEITASLPDYIPAAPAPAKDGSSASATDATAPIHPRIRILKPAEAVRVSYDTVRAQVPEFWDHDHNDDGPSRPAADLVLHIGMALPTRVYAVERRGHRDNYRLPDVDGKLLEDERRHAEQGEGWIWHGVPHELLTDLDVDAVYERWVERCPKLAATTLKISENAGHYLCDFIYFSSLAHQWKKGRPRKVLFFHVPAFSDEESLANGKELVMQLIRSVVEVEMAERNGASKAAVK